MSDIAIRVDNLSKRYRVGLFLLVLVFLLSVTPRLFRTITINSASLQFWFQASQPSSLSLSPSNLPTSHPRAVYWHGIQAKANGDWQKVLDLMQPLVDAGDLYALQFTGQAYELLGDYQSALFIWQQTRNSRSLLRVAEISKQLGRLDIARQAYYAAWEVDPVKGTFPLVEYLRLVEKDYKAAEEVLLESYNDSLSPAHRHLLWDRMRVVLDKQQDWPRAIEIYQQAIEKNPEEWEPHLGLGWALYRLNHDSDLAISEFQEVIRIDPEGGDGYWAIGYVLVNDKKYIEADAWFQSAIERNPERFDWYLTRGNYARSYDFELALHIYLDAIERFPQHSPQILYQLAWNYKLHGKIEQAVTSIEEAVSLDVSNASYYFRAGEIYEEAGQLEKALSAYKTALEINPEDNEVSNAIRRLTEELNK